MRPTDALAHRRMTLDYMRPRSTPDAIDRDRLGETFRSIVEIAEDCDTYYVSSDMTAVAEAAARTMPGQILRRDDLPSERGYLVYDRPIGEIKFSDRPVPVDGFAWLVGGVGEILEHDDDCTHLTAAPCGNCPGESSMCRYYEGADITAEANEEVAKCLQSKCSCQWLERPVVGQGQEISVYPLGRIDGVPCLVPLMRTEPPYGEIKWVTGSRPINDDDGACPALLATWTLMQQSLSVSQRIPADRAERRRCSRIGLPQDVLIVRLRRRSIDAEMQEEPEGAGVSWSHRWLVNGHWRNQWLPSRAAHRLQWIAGYVKGPASKPLVVKDRVAAWVR